MGEASRRKAAGQPVTWSQIEVEAFVPIVTEAYRALMADLRDLFPGREGDAFEIALALLRRCRTHDNAMDAGRPEGCA